MSANEAKPATRPPTGRRTGKGNGERISAGQLRLPSEATAQIARTQCLSAIPQWRIVTAAFECFFRAKKKPRAISPSRPL